MAKPLSILFVSSETYPFAKTGGLADVSYSLPLAIRELGHDIRVMMPKYGSISERKNKIHEINRLRDIPIPVGNESWPATVKSSSMNNPRQKVQAYITTNTNYFDAKKGFYNDPITGEDYPDNDERFIFFNKTVLQTCIVLGWFPDIIHCNDWQTGLIPALIRTVYPNEFKRSKIVYTVHNFNNAGSFAPESFEKTGLPEEAREMVMHKGRLNFVKSGIMYSDSITTVSPTYSADVMSNSAHSDGLNDVIASRHGQLPGVLHGVDMFLWNPKTDAYLARNYDRTNIRDKFFNKEQVLKKMGLPVQYTTPLIGMISRISEQKGIHLLLEAADELFKENIQMILLGEGDPVMQDALRELPQRFPGKVAVKIGFDDELAHLIEAGADMYLMPSLFEPCGLNQQYSLVYGTVPVVRATGGLADTVREFDTKTGQGNGFVFQDFTSDAMLEAVRRAINLFGEREQWDILQDNGMSANYSWSNAARYYAELYRSLIKDF